VAQHSRAPGAKIDGVAREPSPDELGGQPELGDGGRLPVLEAHRGVPDPQREQHAVWGQFGDGGHRAGDRRGVVECDVLQEGAEADP
jgi:hypothetical protein